MKEQSRIVDGVVEELSDECGTWQKDYSAPRRTVLNALFKKDKAPRVVRG
jgi:hypothetical protein